MLRSRMAGRICIWLPSLTVLALSACGGSETGFFSDVASAGSGHGGASGHAGSSSMSSSGSGSGNPGSAGSSNSAGAIGVAGDSSSAGDDGSSGGSGNAGSASGGTSSGGRAGATASGGTSAHAGAAGSGAAAGHAGSATGTAGSGGTNQELSCSDLLKQANQQLDDARACIPNAKLIQCTGTVKNTCGCEVPVQRDDSAETKAYLSTLKKIAAKNCATVCTAQACRLVTDAECKSSSGPDDAGVCTAVSIGPGRGF